MTVHALFDWCVRVLEDVARFCGISYEAANLWIFVVIHPALTLLFFVLFLVFWKKYRRLKRVAAQP